MIQFRNAFCVALLIAAITGLGQYSRVVDISSATRFSIAPADSIASRYPLRARTPSLFERSKGKSPSSANIRKA